MKKKDLMMRVYICCPFADNLARVGDICYQELDERTLPIAPQIYLSQIISETDDRDLAMGCRIELLSMCDYIYVYGHNITLEMQEEIEYAEQNSIEIVYKEIP